MSDNQPTWPTQPGGPTPPTPERGWPAMPGNMAGPTLPATNPLQPLQKKSLAPQGMPGLDTAKRADEQPDSVPVEMPPVRDTGQTPPEERPATEGKTADYHPVADEPIHTVNCPHCHEEVVSYESFCESCGGTLTPTSQPPVRQEVGTETPIEATRATANAAQVTDVEISTESVARQCRECQGLVGPDSYCTNCGAKALSERDHYDERPAAWVGGVTDKGVRHHRNEDAMALSAEPEQHGRAVLVVCDGVSSSQDSDVAALAGARRARDVLRDIKPQGIAGVTVSAESAVAVGFADAVHEANETVIAHTDPTSTNAASCTFVAAVIEADQVYYANLGDSRVYFIADEGPSHMLTVDDSVAQARIALGVSREEAENGPQAHAITRWLGRDARDISPATGMFSPTGPGWVLVCSDGLWNYCSPADDLARLIGKLISTNDQAPSDPVALADTLVTWAIEQGGKDNITVALARLGELPAPAPQPPPAPEQPHSLPTAPDLDALPEHPAPLSASPLPTDAPLSAPASCPTQSAPTNHPAAAQPTF